MSYETRVAPRAVEANSRSNGVFETLTGVFVLILFLATFGNGGAYIPGDAGVLTNSVTGMSLNIEDWRGSGAVFPAGH